MVSSEKIEDSISSRRFGAANILQHTPGTISVYVESTEDKSFWSYILKTQFKSLRFFASLDFFAFSNKKLQTGKKGILNLEAKENLIICIDSDYDYILNTNVAEKVKNSPYIFQTYTYAMENLKCYAESLHTICADVTHNPTEKINFVAFLEEYSKIIYQLFIWHLYFFSLSNEDRFTDFYNIIKIPEKFNLNDIDNSILIPLKNRIDKKISELRQNQENTAQVNLLSEQLKNLELEDKNTYLFIQGHTLYDNVVLNILRVVCDNLKTDSIKEINNSSAEPEHKNKTREDYINKVCNTEEKIKLTLSLNKDFKSCFLFKKITADIENYLATFKQHTQGLNNV